MTFPRRAVQLFAATIVLLMTVSGAFAQGSSSPVLQRIAKTETLRVGMTSEQPPFNFTNRDGRIIGLDVDLAGLLAGAMQVKLEIVELPFVELIPALEEGKVDIVMSGMTSTLQRNLRVPFIGPYYISGKSILTKSETLANIKSAEEMNTERLKIAALGGSTSELFVKSTLAKPKLTTTKTIEEAIRLLRTGEVDAVVADSSTCDLNVLRYPEDKLISLANPLTIEPIGIALAPGDALLVNLVQNYMQALQGTGALDSLQRKWFKNGGWLVQLP
ncbi:MAG: transporter substrate-binding domain-containing protein [Gammaproteobacteria bacterium]